MSTHEKIPPSSERAHGEYDTIKAYAGDFVKLSQVRGGDNHVNQELKGKILTDGLMNAIDVAHVDEAYLAEYIEFVNTTWGSDTTLEDFVGQRREDGTYYLIVAGHSRHAAIQDLEADDEIEPRPILAKVHDVESVWGLIRLQLSENTHSVPAQDRIAMATVEAFRWGLKSGLWKNQKEFLDSSQGTSTSNRMLKEALCFHNLPLNIHQFVSRRIISYSTAVEMGKSVPAVREYLAQKSGYDAADDPSLNAELLEKMVEQELYIRTNHIVANRMNKVNAKRHVSAWHNDIQSSLKKSDEDDALELEFVSPEDQLRAIQQANRRELLKQISEMGQHPSTHFAEAIKLSALVVGQDVPDRVLEKMGQDLQCTLKALGSGAISRVGEPRK